MSRRAEIQVGITVLIAMAILLWGVTWLREFSIARRVHVWHVVFTQTGGLGASDEVQVNGIRKGSVSSMKLVGDHVDVELALASDVVLTTDSKVSIRNVGLMGEKVIAVDLRSTGRPYTSRDTIPGIYEKGIPEVMAQLGGSVEAVASITEQIQALANAMNANGDVAGIVRNFRDASRDLKEMVSENRAALRSTLQNFSAASRTAKSLTTDREANLRRTLDDFSSAAERMDHIAARLDSLTATLNKVSRGQGTVGKLVNDDKVYTDLSQSIAEFRSLIEDIKQNPKKYINLSIF